MPDGVTFTATPSCEEPLPDAGIHDLAGMFTAEPTDAEDVRRERLRDHRRASLREEVRRGRAHAQTSFAIASPSFSQHDSYLRSPPPETSKRSFMSVGPFPCAGHFAVARRVPTSWAA